MEKEPVHGLVIRPVTPQKELTEKEIREIQDKQFQRKVETNQENNTK